MHVILKNVAWVTTTIRWLLYWNGFQIQNSIPNTFNFVNLHTYIFHISNFVLLFHYSMWCGNRNLIKCNYILRHNHWFITHIFYTSSVILHRIFVISNFRADTQRLVLILNRCFGWQHWSEMSRLICHYAKKITDTNVVN